MASLVNVGIRQSALAPSENTEGFQGCLSPHPAAADYFHRLLGFYCCAAVVKEGIPLNCSNLAHQLFKPVTSASGLLTKVNKPNGIPVVGGLEPVGCRRDVATGKLRPHAVCQRACQRVVAHLPKPVRRVAGVGLAAVHDAVPPAALGGVNGLTHSVGILQKPVPEPEASSAAGRCIDRQGTSPRHPTIGISPLEWSGKSLVRTPRAKWRQFRLEHLRNFCWQLIGWEQ